MAVAAVFSLVAAVFWLSAPTVGVFPKKCPTMSKNKPPTVPAGNSLKYSSPPAMMSKARYAAYCATCGIVISPEQQASIDNHIREVIAQRAYDLAFHLLQDGDPIDLDTSGNYGKPDDEDVHRRIANLPDLTAWPTPQEP